MRPLPSQKQITDATAIVGLMRRRNELTESRYSRDAETGAYARTVWERQLGDQIIEALIERNEHASVFTDSSVMSQATTEPLTRTCLDMAMWEWER